MALMHDPFRERKRKYYITALAFMAVAALVDWLFQFLSAPGIITDRFTSPLGAVIDLVAILLLWRRPDSVRALERAGVLVFAAVLIPKFYLILGLPADVASAELSVFLVWFGPLYVMIFLVFNPRPALAVSGTVYAATALGFLRLLATWNAENHPPLLKAMVHLHLSSGVIVAFLFIYARLREQLVRAETLADTLREMAHTDVLVGLPNRRMLHQLLAAEQEAAQRRKQPASLIIFDLDHFKQINDTFGHAVGDQVLVEVTRRVSSCLRKTDHFGRWGGEEFVIICPGTEVIEGTQLAQRLQQVISERPFPVVGTVTASFGVADLREQATLDRWLDRADNALYLAKQKGKNRVEVAS